MLFEFSITLPVRMAASIVSRAERHRMPVLTATVLHGFTAAVSRMSDGFFDKHHGIIDALLVNISAEIALPVLARIEARKPGYLAAAAKRNAVLHNRLWEFEMVEFYSNLFRRSRLESMAAAVLRMEGKETS